MGLYVLSLDWNGNVRVSLSALDSFFLFFQHHFLSSFSLSSSSQTKLSKVIKSYHSIAQSYDPRHDNPVY